MTKVKHQLAAAAKPQARIALAAAAITACWIFLLLITR